MADKVRVLCPSAPSLWIPHLGVQFVDGVAEVDAEVAELLAPFAVHGVVVEADAEAVEPVEPAVADVEEPTKPTAKRAPRKPFG